MGRKENKETNTHTPMPRHAQEKKKQTKNRSGERRNSTALEVKAKSTPF